MARDARHGARGRERHVLEELLAENGGRRNVAELVRRVERRRRRHLHVLEHVPGVLGEEAVLERSRREVDARLAVEQGELEGEIPAKGLRIGAGEHRAKLHRAGVDHDVLGKNVLRGEHLRERVLCIDRHLAHDGGRRIDARAPARRRGDGRRHVVLVREEEVDEEHAPCVSGVVEQPRRVRRVPDARSAPGGCRSHDEQARLRRTRLEVVLQLDRAGRSLEREIRRQHRRERDLVRPGRPVDRLAVDAERGGLAGVDVRRACLEQRLRGRRGGVVAAARRCRSAERNERRQHQRQSERSAAREHPVSLARTAPCVERGAGEISGSARKSGGIPAVDGHDAARRGPRLS